MWLDHTRMNVQSHRKSMRLHLNKVTLILKATCLAPIVIFKFNLRGVLVILVHFGQICGYVRDSIHQYFISNTFYVDWMCRFILYYIVPLFQNIYPLIVFITCIEGKVPTWAHYWNHIITAIWDLFLLRNRISTIKFVIFDIFSEVITAWASLLR